MCEEIASSRPSAGPGAPRNDGKEDPGILCAACANREEDPGVLCAACANREKDPGVLCAACANREKDPGVLCAACANREEDPFRGRDYACYSLSVFFFCTCSKS